MKTKFPDGKKEFKVITWNLERMLYCVVPVNITTNQAKTGCQIDVKGPPLEHTVRNYLFNNVISVPCIILYFSMLNVCQEKLAELYP